MSAWLLTVSQRAAISIAGFVVALANLIAAPQTPQPAMVARTVVTVVAAASTTPTLSSSSFAMASSTFLIATVTPNRLPIVKLRGTTTTASPAATKPVSKPKPTAAAVSPIQPSVPANITAQWLLDNTTIAFKERREGPYDVFLETKISNSSALYWSPTDTKLGGSQGVPQFSVAYSCNPVADVPDPAALDQNIIFSVRGNYDCTISLTPLSGADRRTQSKDFTFVVPPGNLVVLQPSVMNNVLHDDTNIGGFVFENNDTKPVTVTGISLDVSYMGLSTSSPVVLRFIDGRTEATLTDIHIEDLPTDAAQLASAGKNGISVPLSFTIDPNTQKLLTVNVLGVHRLFYQNINPTISLSISGVNTAVAGGPTIINAAKISWSCVVTTQYYDPYATSGAMADGTACH